MPEVVLYGGKGGVGKTTCAAATARASAREGAETLIVSTDPAHSLADVFGTRIDATPTEVASGLAAVETDPARGTERYEALFESLAAELSGVGVDLMDDDLRELFSSGLLPGGDELAALDSIARYADDDRFDRLVFDTAPTGHTLRLLELPDVVDTGVRTALSVRDQVSRKADAARTMLFGPYAGMGGDESEDFSELLAELETVRSLLRDPERASFRVVCVPERVVLAETRRLIERLDDAGVPVGMLVVNRVLEEVDETCDRCRTRRDRQSAIREEIDVAFPDIPTVELPDTTGLDGDSTVARLAARFEG